MDKPILYFDMDGVLADFMSGVNQFPKDVVDLYEGHYDDIPGVFAKMKPVRGAERAVEVLSEYYDVRILSTAPWGNPSAWGDKIEWLKRHFGDTFKKKATLTHDKSKVIGYALVDDNVNDETKSRSGRFPGRVLWLNLTGGHGKCEKECENKAEECRSWYDVCHRLITVPHGDNAWTRYESELYYE